MSKESGTPSNSFGDLSPVVLEDQYTLIPEAVYKSKKAIKRPEVRVKATTIAYNSAGSRSGDFENLEFNLVEIAKAKTTESYVIRSFLKHITLILKSGYYLDGRNPSTIEYIHNRIRELSINTNLPFDLVLRSIVQNTVQYCNAFMVFVRSSDRSSGRTIEMFGRTLPPIAGVFSADPTCMSVKRNKHGNAEQWRQRTQDGQEKKFPWYNVLHFYYNKEDGFVSGTPWVLPVLDDIRALRRLEELNELLVSKHTFPLFHYVVGTETAPAQEYDDGHSEVDDIRAELEYMPSEGCIVTPERHSITAVGAEGKALDLQPYLEYWRQRVISGLGMSGIDLGMGDSANRATAQQLSKGLADFCTDLQLNLGVFIDNFFFDILLEEGGYILNEMNRVHLRFPPIDTEQLVLMEKHTQYMFQNNLITRTEARQRMGSQPITTEMERDTSMHLIDIPLAVIKAVDEPYTPEAKKALSQEQKAANTTAKSANQKARSALSVGAGKKKGKSEGVNRPSNQYGKLGAKTRPVRDQIVAAWKSISNIDLAEDLETFSEYAKDRIQASLAHEMEKGMQRFKDQHGDKDVEFFVGKSMRRYFMEHCFNPKLHALTNTLASISANSSKVKCVSALEALGGSLESMLDKSGLAAHNFGFRYAALISDYGAVRWKLKEDACDDCKELKNSRLSVSKLTFDELIPTHPDCVDGLMVVDIDKRVSVTDEDIAYLNTVAPLTSYDQLDVDHKEYEDTLVKLEEIQNKKLSKKVRRKLPESVFCGPNRTFPVPDCQHVRIARIFLVKYKGPGDKGEIRACINAKAKAMGCK